MMRPTIRLGRVAGIEIGIHWSLLVIGAVLVTSLAGGMLPEIQPDAGGDYWAAAILATIGFFASILAHELAHSFVAIHRGQRVEGITLWLLGGVAQLRDEAKDARSELLVAIAGPVTSIVLGALLTGVAFGLDATLEHGSLLPAIALYLGIINVILGLFNLLPGAPLDGGRVLTAVLWAWRKDHRRAQITSARAGRVVGIGLVALGIYGFVAGSAFGDLWTALVGWFLIDASRAEETGARTAKVLDERTIGELMVPNPPPLPSWTAAADVAAALGDPLPPYVLLLGFGGEVEALLATSTLAEVPPHAARAIRTRDLGIPVAHLRVVAPQDAARDAVAEGVPVLVGADGRIVGVVGIEELRRALGRGSPATRG